MTLNPQVAALLSSFEQMPAVDYSTVTPQAVREMNQPIRVGPPPEVAEVRELSLDLPGRTLAGRLYIPHDAGTCPPLLLFYHGGGWVFGDLDLHDTTVRALARASNAAVLAVDYRLAPETKFPGPLDDCYDALLWAAHHASELGVDAKYLAVSGDSAGGNLAAAVAIRARDEGGPKLAHQLLIYPVTDTDFSRASHADNGSGAFLLSTAAMRWFWTQYVGDHREVDSLAAVLRHANLSGLPPATVLVAQYDPLRDEGLAYAEALLSAGVPVETEEAPGMIHGFFSLFQVVPDAQPYIDRAGQRLKAAFA